MVTVYSAPNTRALRVIWLLEEIGVKAEIKSMPYPPRKHAPDYVAVNPTGLVPLLVDGEVRLSESMAICDYLAIKHGSPLVVRPNDPERPQFLQWLWYGESTLMTPLSRLNVVSQVERKGPEVDASKRYALGMGTLALARASLESDDLPTRVQPHLDALSRRYGVTAIGLELPNLEHMIVVALSRAQTPVRLHVDVGSRFPTLISATGRCVAAFGNHPAAELEMRFKALRWDNAPSWTAWRKEVEVTRRQGYSIDRDTYIAGVTIVSVPVLEGSGPLSRGIAAVGISGQLGRARAIELAHDMQAVGRAVGQATASARR